MNKGFFLNLDQWPRRAQYLFFRDYKQPFFNLCAEIPITKTLAWCRKNHHSFSLATWFLCQQGINHLEPFKYRLRGPKVWVHEEIRIATTILADDETFRFCYFSYVTDFAGFCAAARAEIEAPKAETMEDRPEDDAVIHGSTIPWLRFTSVAHARDAIVDDAVPRIAFGRYGEGAGRKGDEMMMPMSVEVHHALMDGLHVARLFDWMSEAMSKPEEWLGS